MMLVHVYILVLLNNNCPGTHGSVGIVMASQSEVKGSNPTGSNTGFSWNHLEAVVEVGGREWREWRLWRRLGFRL
jgi:hypothetical protein